jgi:phospholipid N-methyltransferase
MMTATYSPEDNKLRLSSSTRLDSDTYTRVKEAGFSWAPKQQIFVAPMWTPAREDLLIELCGEIEDEDTSLVERAGARAERFEEYSDRRAEEADRAREQVEGITSGIPLGQPILVGHHSERHARKDAERIENGMRRAVKMWETSKYWQARARGAIRAAKYKERPDVRARRIKGLEADKRAHERDIERAETFTKAWSASLEWDPEVRKLTREQARGIANYDHAGSHRCYPLTDYPRNPPASQYEGPMGLWTALGNSNEEAIITPEQARETALRCHAANIRYARRWLEHIGNRLEYERAMLAEDGGLAADQFDIQPGGRVRRRGEWFVVKKLNKRDGVANSVTVFGHWATTIPIEEVQGYESPAAETAQKVAEVSKLLPLCNFRTAGCIEMTTAEWKEKSKWGDALAVRSFDAAGQYHWKRDQNAPFVYRHRSRYFLRNENQVVHVFLTDSKEVQPPASAPECTVKRGELAPQKAAEETAERATQEVSTPRAESPFDGMKDQLRAGMQVVTAPQLFPTPPELARRMADEAGMLVGKRVLEPSAGTGNLIRAIFNNATGADCVRVVAVEQNADLVRLLQQQREKTLYANENNFSIRHADFLQCRVDRGLSLTGLDPSDLGAFDAVLMNPPFENASDIKHIEHAITFLKPGGVLVAICANGPRQRERFLPMCKMWQDLPAGTFKEAGTNVNTALLVIRKDEQCSVPAQPNET